MLKLNWIFLNTIGTFTRVKNYFNLQYKNKFISIKLNLNFIFYFIKIFNNEISPTGHHQKKFELREINLLLQLH